MRRPGDDAEVEMPETTQESFRCMMRGHVYQESVIKREDKERSCPKCRSNSIRHLKGAAGRQPPPSSPTPAPEN